RVETAVAGDGRFVRGGGTGRFEAGAEVVEGVGEERGVPPRRGDGCLDAAMDLLLAALEPDAAAARERDRLGYLGHAEEAAVEGAGAVFAAGLESDLDVCDAEDGQ